MNKKNILATLLFIVITFLVATIYFSQDVIKGKEISSSDVVQFTGMAKWPVEHREATGEEALWNVGMFSGMPDFLTSTGSATMAVQQVHLFFTNLMFNSIPASQFILAGLCFFVLLRAFGVNSYISIFGSLVYALNTYSIINIEVGHNTKLWAIAYACLVLAGMRLSFTGKWRWGLPLFLLGLALELGADHIQITYYLVFICVIYGLSELYFAIKNKKVQEFSSIGVALVLLAVVAGGTKVAKLWMTQEYGKYSIRGERILTPLDNKEDKNANPDDGLSRDYAFSWSQGKIETLTLLVPYFYGGGSTQKIQSNMESYGVLAQYIGEDRLEGIIEQDQLKLPLYFGDQPFTIGPLYTGAITCFLFVLGLFILDKRDKYWMLAGAILAMMFAWGRNLEWFNYFLFDYLPGFNKLRSVSMALSLTLILLPLMGFKALDKFLREKAMTSDLQKKLIYATAIVGGLCVLVWLSSLTGDYRLDRDPQFAQQIFGDKNPQAVAQLTDALAADRSGLRASDALRSLGLILLAFGAIYAYSKQKLSALLTFLIVGGLAFGDVWSVAKRYLYDASFKEQKISQSIVKTPADELILQDSDPHYRVYNIRNPFQEAFTSYYHKSLGGYSPAKLRRYNDLIERQFNQQNQLLIQKLRAGSTDFSDLHILNMLNAKYIKLGDSEREVVRNDAALGNAWFVHNVIDATNPDEEMAKLGEINTRTTAVINKQEFSISEESFAMDSNAAVKLLEESPRKMTYQTNSTEEGLVVFSEIYYPKGWTATIDGKDAEIIRANYLLRAIKVPEGQHTVEMQFNPQSYETGMAITKASGYVFLLLFFAGIGYAFYHEKKNSNEDIDEGDDIFSKPNLKQHEPKAEVASQMPSSEAKKSGQTRKRTNKKRRPKR